MKIIKESTFSSALLLATNCIHLLLFKNDPVYLTSFSALFLTSIMYHWDPRPGGLLTIWPWAMWLFRGRFV